MTRTPTVPRAIALLVGAFARARPAWNAAAILVALLAGGLLTGQGLDPLRRMALADAQRLIHHADAEVRGEAAMLLGSSRDQRHYETLVRLARDPEPAAALGGIVALGLLAAPDSGHWLGQYVDESVTRPRPEAVAAALALGLLPEDNAAAALDRYLARFLRSSYRRQRDVLAALLVGLCTAPHPSRNLALRKLLEDAANRDPGLRALLVTALGRSPQGLDGELVRRLLDQGSREERLAVVRVLLRSEAAADMSLLDRMVRLQERDACAETRAAALAWLTHARHLPALEMAAAAVKSADPAEAEQGVRTALLLGGGGMRGALEQHIRGEKRPAVKAALLTAFDPPFSEEHVAACLRLAADRREGPYLRAAAALAVGRSGDRNAAPVLRDLFREVEDPATLRQLARVLMTLDPEPPDLERLSPDGRPSELTRSPARIEALLSVEHPACVRLVLARLEAEDTSSAVKAGLLRAVRLAWYPSLAADLASALPEPLAPMFR